MYQINTQVEDTSGCQLVSHCIIGLISTSIRTISFTHLDLSIVKVTVNDSSSVVCLILGELCYDYLTTSIGYHVITYKRLPIVMIAKIHRYDG